MRAEVLNADLPRLGCVSHEHSELFTDLREAQKRHESSLSTSLAWHYLRWGKQRRASKKGIPGLALWLGGFTGGAGLRAVWSTIVGVLWSRSTPQEPPWVLQLILPFLNTLAVNWFSCEKRSSCTVSLYSLSPERSSSVQSQHFLRYYLHKRTLNCWEHQVHDTHLP